MVKHNLISSLKGVSRLYDNGRITALRNVTLDIPQGEFTVVVGPSGSGKSTLMHLMCGIDRPTEGHVFFDGSEPGSSKEWSRLRAERIGFVFQAFYLLPTMTALENVQVPMFGVRPNAENRRDIAMELLSRVGLADRAGHLPNELSGGERQRVAIARALANSPDLIIADEPTGNLDSRSSLEILDLLAGVHADNGTTLIIVTHNSEITSRADRKVHLMDGRIISR